MQAIIDYRCVAGTGKARVKAYVAEGASVIACDINQAALAELSADDGIDAKYLDVTDRSAMIELLNDAGPLDVLFKCARFVAAGSILECDTNNWNFSFDLNVAAMLNAIKSALSAMIENGSGSIINMASASSSIKGVSNRFAYCASKAAVVGMTKSVAADFVTQGIRCNAICPRTIESPSLHDRLRATGNYEQAMKDFIARHPIGRIGKAEKIAALAVYLGSDDSAFTTGQTHTIDGG